MVDLARQAFSTNNFGLAADIYERTIQENGPASDLYLGLADSFARAGQFTKAFDAYTNAFRLGRVTHEKLKHLVTALIGTLGQDTNKSAGCQQDSMKKSCMFTCIFCRGIVNDPVTINCGHTFCRKCLERDTTKTCKVCGIVHYRLKPASIRTNIVLSNLIHRWFPDSCRAAELKAEGNKFFERKDFERAITAYTEAIQLSDADHLLFSNRSHAYAALDQFASALEDAEKVVKLRPDWPKGFFRKGTALFELGRHEDAVIAFLQCLALDKEVTSAKDYLSRALHKILKQLPPDDPKVQQRQLECNPSLFRRLLNSNFTVSPFLSQLGADTLTHLKRIMDDTVAEASNFQPPQTSCSSMAGSSKGAHSICMRDDSTSNRTQGSMFERQRCYSTPTLEVSFSSTSPERYQRQRSRSQSPDRPNSPAAGSRKRCRNPSVTQPLSPSHSSPQKCLRSEMEGSTVAAADLREIDPSLLCVEDLECSLCYRLYYQPVTTPCGHSFCRECLDRCLDHQTSCPMCKSSLAEYLAERRSTVTEALQAIIINYFHGQHLERQQIHEDEVSELARMGQDNQHEIPVFVCTVGFPTVPCPLHIFEPRYRLMIRQSMESGTRQFGMCTCLTDNEEDFSDYGCMLEIRDVHFFPDGRSLVDTVGGRRFRVLSRGRRDGYNTAKVEYLLDDHIGEAELPEIQVLQNEVYAATKAWLDSLPVTHKSRILRHFGNIPDLDPNPQGSPNGPAWAWWSVAVLPLEPRVQLVMLAMNSYRERLEAVRKVLRFINRPK